MRAQRAVAPVGLHRGWIASGSRIYRRGSSGGRVAIGWRCHWRWKSVTCKKPALARRYVSMTCTHGKPVESFIVFVQGGRAVITPMKRCLSRIFIVFVQGGRAVVTPIKRCLSRISSIRCSAWGATFPTTFLNSGIRSLIGIFTFARSSTAFLAACWSFKVRTRALTTVTTSLVLTSHEPLPPLRWLYGQSGNDGLSKHGRISPYGEATHSQDRQLPRRI